MRRIKFVRVLCSLFPPIVAKRIMGLLFPRERAIANPVDFVSNSITGSPFKGNTLDPHAYRFCIHGYYDWRNIVIANSILKKKSGDIVEIGANIGTETISFCDIVKGRGNVHVFEPMPSHVDGLNEIKKTVGNLQVYKVAASDSSGFVSFQVHDTTTSGMGKILNGAQPLSSTHTIEVKKNKLDVFIDNFNQVRLIACDTEGHEPLVLNGAIKTIRKHRPVVIVEVCPSLLIKYASAKPKVIYDYFVKEGYEVWKVTWLTLTKVNSKDLSSSREYNWACIPKESKNIRKTIQADLIFRGLLPWFILRSFPDKLSS